MIIKIDDLFVSLTRKNIKRINIRIKQDGSVNVSAPYLVSESHIADFVREKRCWIDKNVEKMKAKAATTDSPLTQSDKRRKREALRARIEQRLPEIEMRTGLRCNGWTIRDMHTRWGSCNTETHHINLSLMLADRSDEELDYVITHELVHTRVANHGDEFKSYMDRLMPNWRKIRRQMNK